MPEPGTVSASSVDLEVLEAIAGCRDDPLGYVMLAFDWRHGDLADHDGPDVWQRELLEQIGVGTLSLDQAIARSETYEPLRFARASGHGIGKSALVAWIILWAMSTRPHLAGVVTANTGTQLETKTWRELAVWHRRAINRHWFEWTATRFYHLAYPETWFVAAVPWSEKRSEAFAGLHGEHVLLIFDEASAIPDPIWQVAEGAQTTGEVIWCVFGNPTRNTGHFRECFGRLRHRWNTAQIDSRGCRMANREQARQWVEDYGEDSDFVRVRVRGQFPRAGSTQFISDELMHEAQERALSIDDGAPLLIGVDVARFGDDQSVIRFRRGRDARSIPPRKYRGVDTMQLAGHVIEAIEATDPEAVFIDGAGVGGGVVDRVTSLLPERRRRIVHEVQSGANAGHEKDYHNKIAECYALMREWLKTGSIDSDPELAADLPAREYGFDRENRIQLEKKEDLKKRGLASPDNADALAMTFAFPVGRRDVARELEKRRRAATLAREHFAFQGEGSWMR